MSIDLTDAQKQELVVLLGLEPSTVELIVRHIETCVEYNRVARELLELTDTRKEAA
jgi:hypothetical protein